MPGGGGGGDDRARFPICVSSPPFTRRYAGLRVHYPRLSTVRSIAAAARRGRPSAFV